MIKYSIYRLREKNVNLYREPPGFGLIIELHQLYTKVVISLKLRAHRYPVMRDLETVS
ncbi:hypothetical protein PITCH_A970001 [uncultured Desulfobacterium sp.]|uniref:Uncharacterized protein n=1 Tax=uncultured Desulfobacterium sp. TaxID=201089 RepID=A0A445N455_9BACT|nr:hypothetical protein PITCH_A970001 [uncultured Desulfobacterium sp.]